MPKDSNNSPEAVMAQRRISSQNIKTVNRNLFFFMKFSFYKFDRHVVYASNNSETARATPQTPPPATRATDARGNITTPTVDVFNPITNQGQENSRRATFLQNPRATVIMPIPPELFESYQIEFGQAGIGLISRTLLDAYINGRINLEELQAGIGRTGSQVRDNLIESLPDGLQGAAEQQAGKIVNPVYNTVFRGVPIRSHEFSWRIAPESPEETADIEGVLNTLREHSLPPFEKSGEINNIMYPDFCKIELTPSVFRFPKPLFISSLSINHAPEGIPSFFRSDSPQDAKPTGYEIKMRLTEATALVRQDIIDQPEAAQTT